MTTLLPLSPESRWRWGDHWAGKPPPVVEYRFLLEEAAKTLRLSRVDATVAIQGCGNVGSWTARLVDELGYKVVAISDLEGGVYNAKGLKLSHLTRNRPAGLGLSGLPNGDFMTNAELLELNCDVLIPAAIDNVITEENAPRVRASLILEATNHPLTPEADDILARHGTVVLPDILVNAGGVVVSYFQWSQNLQEFRWEEDRVNQELRKKMPTAFQTVKKRSLADKTTYREAAFDIGVERVARAVELRGFV